MESLNNCWCHHDLIFFSPWTDTNRPISWHGFDLKVLPGEEAPLKCRAFAIQKTYRVSCFLRNLSKSLTAGILSWHVSGASSSVRCFIRSGMLSCAGMLYGGARSWSVPRSGDGIGDCGSRRRVTRACRSGNKTYIIWNTVFFLTVGEVASARAFRA